MSEHETSPLPIPMYAEGQSKNESPYGHSGIDGFGKIENDFNELEYLRWLYAAKDNIMDEHERQLLNDVKRLKKHKGHPKKLYPERIDTKLWMDKADKEIVRVVENLIA